MLFKWIIVLYNWLFKHKPIVTFIVVSENGEQQIIKHRFKSIRIPNEDEILYFNEDGPYYLTNRVVHFISDRHYIWVMLKPFAFNPLGQKAEKN
jgi:hypothetical protein